MEKQVFTDNQIDELQKCINSFSYFANTYLKINDYKKGMILFKLFPFQERFIKECEENRYVIATKFRQGGFTTITLAYMLWKCLFQLDKRILVISKTDRESGSLLMLATALFNSIPDWMKTKVQFRRGALGFPETGARIKFQQGEGCCGVSVTDLVIDEAAFIPNMDEKWKCLYPLLMDKGKCIVLSTTNGIGNWFQQVYHDAVVGKNLFRVVAIHYTAHPDYNNPEWVAKMRKNLGENGFKQEIEQQFVVEYPILADVKGKVETIKAEAEIAKSQTIIDKLKDLKLQIMAQNPQLLGVGVPPITQEKNMNEVKNEMPMGMKNEVNLDFYYGYQFVSQEKKTNLGGGPRLGYFLKHTPVIAGTTTGHIYGGEVLVYTFVVSQAGTFIFTAVGTPSVPIMTGAINLASGKIELIWAADPGENSIVVSYEYGYSKEAKNEVPMPLKKNDAPTIYKTLDKVENNKANHNALKDMQIAEDKAFLFKKDEFIDLSGVMNSDCYHHHNTNEVKNEMFSQDELNAMQPIKRHKDVGFYKINQMAIKDKSFTEQLSNVPRFSPIGCGDQSQSCDGFAPDCKALRGIVVLKVAIYDKARQEETISYYNKLCGDLPKRLLDSGYYFMVMPVEQELPTGFETFQL